MAPSKSFPRGTGSYSPPNARRGAVNARTAVIVDGRAGGLGTARPSGDAIRMAAFISPDPDDRSSFDRRWARLRSDDSTTNRVVEIDGRVVGHIASFDLEGHREVTYWIGREDWGRGIARRALQEFLQLEASRPLYAGAASDNAASIRVLTKCGFRVVGEGRGFAHGRNEETDEVVLRLDA